MALAERGNCAVHLVHHTRKPGGMESEVTTESSRGGSSQTDACRVMRPINRMSEKEVTTAAVDNRRLYFRTLHDKANLQPPAEKADWFKLVSVDLGNGRRTASDKGRLARRFGNRLQTERSDLATGQGA